jgi:hypothetical protein
MYTLVVIYLYALIEIVAGAITETSQFAVDNTRMQYTIRISDVL